MQRWGIAAVVAVLLLGVGAGVAQAAPTWSVDDVVVSEGDSGTTQATFTITASGISLLESASVDYATVDGTANAPGDYTTAADTATVQGVFGNTANVTVPVSGDTTPESDETFQLVLSNPSSGTIDDGTGQATIVNDDPPHLHVSSPHVSEKDGAAVFTVSLDGAATVTAHYATADGSAFAGSDYTAQSGTLSFSRTDTAKTVSVPLVNDSALEGDETFELQLSNPSGAASSGNDLTGTATIADDDAVVPAAHKRVDDRLVRDERPLKAAACASRGRAYTRGTIVVSVDLPEVRAPVPGHADDLLEGQAPRAQARQGHVRDRRRQDRGDHHADLEEDAAAPAPRRQGQRAQLRGRARRRRQRRHRERRRAPAPRALSEPLGEPGRAGRAVVCRRPGGELARARAQRRVRQRRAHREPDRAAASRSAAAGARRGPPRPPAPRSRSCRRPPARRPPAPPARQRAHDGAVPAVADDDVAARHRLRVGDPRRPAARWPARAIGAVGQPAVPTWRARAPARPPAPPAPRAAAGARDPATVDGATSTSGVVARRRLDVAGSELELQRPDDVLHVLGHVARVLELRERRRPGTAAATCPPCTRSSGAIPSRRRVSLSSRAPALEPAADEAVQSPPQPRGPTGSAAAARPSSTAGSPARRRDRRAARASPTARRSSSAASAGASVRMSATTTSGAIVAHQRLGLARRPHDRLVGLQRPLAAWGRRGTRAPRRTSCPAARPPAASAATSARDLVAARGELAAQRDHRERVPGVAERPEQEPRELRDLLDELGDAPQLLEPAAPCRTPAA